MLAVPSTTRANLPSRYAFSLVSPPPPNTPTASAPCSARVRASPAATRSSASGQLAERSGPPGRSRSSGPVSRAARASSAGAVRPLPHSAPRFTGKSGRSSTSTGSPAPSAPSAPARSGPGDSRMPHCSEQYGQWVSVAAARAAGLVDVMPRKVAARCFATASPMLRPRYASLTPPGRQGARPDI